MCNCNALWVATVCRLCVDTVLRAQAILSTWYLSCHRPRGIEFYSPPLGGGELVYTQPQLLSAATARETGIDGIVGGMADRLTLISASFRSSFDVCVLDSVSISSISAIQ